MATGIVTRYEWSGVSCSRYCRFEQWNKSDVLLRSMVRSDSNFLLLQMMVYFCFTIFLIISSLITSWPLHSGSTLQNQTATSIKLQRCLAPTNFKHDNHGTQLSEVIHSLFSTWAPLYTNDPAAAKTLHQAQAPLRHVVCPGRHMRFPHQQKVSSQPRCISSKKYCHNGADCNGWRNSNSRECSMLHHKPRLEW